MGHGPWPNSDSFPLQLAILPWYSDGLVLKSKFLSVDQSSTLSQTRWGVPLGYSCRARCGLQIDDRILRQIAVDHVAQRLVPVKLHVRLRTR